MNPLVARKRALLAAAFALVGVVALAIVPGFTQANWTDEVAVSTSASAGDWDTITGGDGGITPATDDTLIANIDWQFASRSQLCANVTVETSSASPADWAIDVDTAAAPWNGTTAGAGAIESGGVGVMDGAVLHVTGNYAEGAPFDSSHNNTPLSQGQHASVRLCVYDAGNPAIADPSWYSVEQHAPVLSENKVCTSIDLEGQVDPADYRFYYGWEATMDLSEAWSMLADAGYDFNYVSMNPDPEGNWNYAVAPEEVSPTQDLYQLSSETNSAIKGEESQTLTWCLHGTRAQ